MSSVKAKKVFVLVNCESQVTWHQVLCGHEEAAFVGGKPDVNGDRSARHPLVHAVAQFRYVVVRSEDKNHS